MSLFLILLQMEILFIRYYFIYEYKFVRFIIMIDYLVNYGGSFDRKTPNQRIRIACSFGRLCSFYNFENAPPKQEVQAYFRERKPSERCSGKLTWCRIYFLVLKGQIDFQDRLLEPQNVLEHILHHWDKKEINCHITWTTPRRCPFRA